ncbi:rod shape-determining protein MreC [Methylophaga nitratireducenticrescens]|uniref:Cell shape-determining protein MreC n=2 Tax=Methylophaga nitratireducenticrescens TaxID=754476 RepID=I1XMJ8_METNJ|nr:rod shape-determining protein MreC [Methylophaga nitratireducenticrescens]AUZ85349.1 rod shape-determining protein MreC [Methylophaga nitratireducenticrescens]
MLLALVASLLLYFVDSRLDYFKPVRATLSTVVYPIQKIASMPEDMANWFSDFFQGHRQLREKIMKLEAQNLTNSVRMQKMQALESENMRLRELLGSSFRLQERVQVSELLSVDLDPFYQHVIIDKGETFGVYEGQPVLDSLGVMGQVAEVSQFSSRVVLLTDPSHSIPVQIVRNGLRAVVTGRGLGENLQMEFLPHNADVRVGDLLVTSGLGGRFPVGYPVGKVSSVDFPQGKSFAEINVTPAARLSTSREIMLVLPGEKIDFGITFPLQAEKDDLPAKESQPVVDDFMTPSEGNN